jgi:hypothetical protein
MNYNNVPGDVSQNVRDAMLDDEVQDDVVEEPMTEEELENMIEELRQQFGDDHDEVEYEGRFNGVNYYLDEVLE